MYAVLILLMYELLFIFHRILSYKIIETIFHYLFYFILFSIVQEILLILIFDNKNIIFDIIKYHI